MKGALLFGGKCLRSAQPSGLICIACILLFCSVWHSPAAILYVDVNSSNPTPPYSDWTTAAQTIQDAVNAASTGDEVLVTNGVYQTGGEIIIGSLLTRVVVMKVITIQSVNGPSVTAIQGDQIPGTLYGDGATRCVFLTNNATLIGFTLTNGATRGISGSTAGERIGGAIYCRASTCVVSNCVIVGNASVGLGGGAYQGSFFNCTLSGNSGSNGGGAYGAYLNNCLVTSNTVSGSGGGANLSTGVNCTFISNSSGLGGGVFGGDFTNCTFLGNSSGSGGGAYSGYLQACLLLNNSAANNGGGACSNTLINCALVGNSASMGGGAYSGGMNNCTVTANSAVGTGGGIAGTAMGNCIVYYNTAALSPNWSGGISPNYCCLTPLPPSGTGDFTNAPQFATAFHLSAGSPCIGAGEFAYVTGTDIDGEPWANPPSIGCDEFNSATSVGSLAASIRAAYTNVVVGSPLSFIANITGVASSNSWNFGDGSLATNLLNATHAWNVAGNYPVILTAYNSSNPGGISATVTVHVVSQQIYYVSATSAAPSSPYTSWATAARNIQDAVSSATVVGAQVLVTNGTYSVGGATVYGSLTNRVAVTMPLTIKSVNGPAVTTIAGAQSGTVVRGVFLCSGATLSGFSVTNSATKSSGDLNLEESGGAVWCSGAGSVITNCIIRSNTASYNGGGVFSGTLLNCTLTGNKANNFGGGASVASLNNCTLLSNTAAAGAGAYSSTLSSCGLTNNSATSNGGGAEACNLTNCTIAGCSANNFGGGMHGGFASYCSLLYNSATNSSYPFGGGASGANLTNCIVSGNISQVGGGFEGCTAVGCSILNNSATMHGGGSGDSTLINCVLSGNTATNEGGGAFNGSAANCVFSNNVGGLGGGASEVTLIGCELFGNTADNGGGANACSLTNCALIHNTALTSGGGSYAAPVLNNCTLVGNYAGVYGGGDYASAGPNNCILYLNDAPIGSNYIYDTLNYCCTTPMPTNGIGNIAVNPQLLDSVHIAMASPCRGTGSASYSAGTDIDGETWAATPSMGCDEPNNAASATSSASIQATYTNVAISFPVNLLGTCQGIPSTTIWNFGDGTTVTNDSLLSHAWKTTGNYQVIFSAYNAIGGISATSVIHVVTQPIHYVNIANSTPAAPYTTPATAATNIQDAVNAATVAGAMVLVSDGVYASGGKSVYGILTNRVAVTLPLVLKSVNGPAVTRIEGEPLGGEDPATGIRQGKRCLYLAPGASVSGFTLTNASTIAPLSSYSDQQESGGGAFCASPSVVLSNCVIIQNFGNRNGGGVFSGTLYNCTIATNGAGSGAGAFYSDLRNCVLMGNSVDWIQTGGGAYGGTLENCTLVGNNGWGASSATLVNCIAYHNDANCLNCALTNCCTDLDGFNNVTNEPAFVNWTNGDFHLTSSSPCINSGNNAAVATSVDVDGNPRIAGGTVDIGAYEYQNPTSILSYAWAQQYGLPTDGTADHADPDGDGVNNWQEWIAGTDPTSALSALRMSQLITNAPGLTVTWQSVTNRTYYLQRSINLSANPAFSTLQSNIVGQFLTTTFIDATATNKGPYFYRVGIQ